MRGRLIIAIALALVGCRRSTDKPRPPLASQAPVVVDARVLLGEGVAPPPVLVIVAADGAVSVADAPDAPGVVERWGALDQPPPRAPVAVDRQALPDLIGEAVALGGKIEPRAKQVAGGGAAPDRARFVDAAVAPDDQPPPPEDDPEEDGADDWDPATTMVMLEEGKMGRKHPDRAEGQDALDRSADPERSRAIRAARQAGVLGAPRRSDEQAPTADGVDANPDLPRRAAVVVGATYATGDRPARALLIAAPTAKAAPVVDLLVAIDGAALGVASQGRLRALRVGFGLLGEVSTRPPWGEPWVEVRVGASELVVEAVPSPAVAIPFGAAGVVDAAALGAAYAAARGSLGNDDRRDVDVLVGPDTDVQRLVDVLAALDGAGARLVALGHVPPAAELATRGKRIPRAVIGQPQSAGDLDKPVIRATVARALPKIKACYEQALAANPALAGTVHTQFFIAPNGGVITSSASGVDPAVATCVAAIIKAVEFPKPAGGGGVLVKFPFTFRN